MKKLYDERFEVWFYDKKKEQFVCINETFDDEVKAIIRKKELNKILEENEMTNNYTYRIIKQIRTTDYLVY